MTSSAKPVEISPQRLAVFRWYARRLFSRRFTALRCSNGEMPRPITRPTVLYANHASWWDPIVMLLVTRWAYPQVAFYAPIDAAALARYPALARIGFFGVQPASAAGARRFLRAAESILAQPRSAMAMTPQGRFTDVRERPVHLKGGLARLLLHVPTCEARPVAIEYPFWDEARPEALVRFGSAGVAAHGQSHEALTRALALQLERELDALAARACRREPADFVTLVEGRSGIGFMQDLPGRLRAWRNGSRFEPRHAAVRAASEAGQERP